MKPLETTLTCHEGNLGLNVPDGVLPGFLIDAYNLATTGRRRCDAQPGSRRVSLWRSLRS